MNKILITEFVNENSLQNLKKNFEVYYDEKLWDQTEKLIELIKNFDGLIVRNKSKVNKNLLDTLCLV